MIGLAMATKRNTEISPASRLARAVRKAEIAAETKIHDKIRKGVIQRGKDDGAIDPGTGQTVIKMRMTPLAQLIEARKIGPEEVHAAQEISFAFFVLSARLAVRGINYERTGGGGMDTDWRASTAHAVNRYQKFANHWSDRHKAFGDPTLAILIACIVDEQSIRGVAIDNHCARSRAERALIAGLRDYAARAGTVQGQQAKRWKDEADRVFGPAELETAMRRARFEK